MRTSPVSRSFTGRFISTSAGRRSAPPSATAASTNRVSVAASISRSMSRKFAKAARIRQTGEEYQPSRVYEVEPTGDYEEDPVEGRGSGAFMTRHPVRVVRELEY
jgi:hypothetical protein